MRVLHVLGAVRPSGAEVMLKVAAPHFRRQGVDADIVSIGETPGEYAEALRSSGYAIHHVPFGKTPAFFRRLFSFLRRGRYDVVHIHTERARFHMVLAALLATSAQVVCTVHALFPFEGGLRWRRSVQRRTLSRLGVPFVSVSRSVRRNEKDRFGISSHLVSNWYDADSHVPASAEARIDARRSLGLPEDRFIVLSVGNCSEWKNHGALIESLAVLGKEVPFLYLHAGVEEPGSPERALAAERGIGDRVRFLGFADNVPELLHAADVFVMSSLQEGCSIAALEAMGAGVPVILTDVPGLNDLRDVSADIVWTKGSAPELAEALRFLAGKDLPERTEIGRRLHRSVRVRYGIEQGVEAYMRIYRREERLGAGF